jgi:hypothetical protein
VRVETLTGQPLLVIAHANVGPLAVAVLSLTGLAPVTKAGSTAALVSGLLSFQGAPLTTSLQNRRRAALILRALKP